MSLQGLRQFSRDKLPLILGVYIVLQPILDILTALGVKAEFPVTVGVVVRALFMALSFLYVVFVSRFPGKKWCLAALGVLLGYLALFMLQLLLIGGLSLCFANLQETVKTFFAPFVAVFLIAVYKEYGTYVSTRAIAWSCGIYTGVILLAFLTGTSYLSYGNSGYGYNGWFYAANEISCIVAIASPALLFYCLKELPSVTKKTWWKGALILWVLASVVFTADFIGTKAAFGIIVLYMIAALIWSVIRQFQAPSRENLIRLGVLALMLAAVFALYSISALNAYITNVMDPLIDVPSDEIDNIWSSPIADANEGTWLRELISSSPLVQRIDTAAYGYRIDFMIEIDPLAILIRHGILGFVLYFAPYAVFFVAVLRRFFRHPLKALSSLKYCSYLYACLIALAIALFVGHALVSPAVSIFVLVAAMQLWAVSAQEDPDSLPAGQ